MFKFKNVLMVRIQNLSWKIFIILMILIGSYIEGSSKNSNNKNVFSKSRRITELGPKPGDVFREYSWTEEKYHILGLNEKPIEIPGDIDLVNATKAEIVMEMANEHLGYEVMMICLNGKNGIPSNFRNRHR